MGIVDYEKERWEVKPINDFAQELYNNQLKSITNIAHTDWYKEIKRYWTSIKDSGETDLKTVKPENLANKQMQCKISEEFLNFLDNLESAVDVQKQTR